MQELGLNIPSLIVFLVNFALLLVILYFFAYKPILKMLDQRSDRIRESLKAKQEAAESEARTQEQLQEARRQGQKLLEDARALAEKYREDEMAKAREEAEAFVARAREEIQQERDSAVEEVKRHFAVLAIQAAERVIGQELDVKTHRELIVQVLEEDQEARKD